jgi:hypothetical protein
LHKNTALRFCEGDIEAKLKHGCSRKGHRHSNTLSINSAVNHLDSLFDRLNSKKKAPRDGLRMPLNNLQPQLVKSRSESFFRGEEQLEREAEFVKPNATDIFNAKQELLSTL